MLTRRERKRNFHDINIRHQVAHLHAFREAEEFARKLERELNESKQKPISPD